MRIFELVLSSVFVIEKKRVFHIYLEHIIDPTDKKQHKIYNRTRRFESKWKIAGGKKLFIDRLCVRCSSTISLKANTHAMSRSVIFTLIVSRLRDTRM